MDIDARPLSYLSRSKFDPWTLRALLTEFDRRGADILHMHGYGATIFGRLAAARRGLPTVLHEHANLTDTLRFQRVADRLLAPYTDLAIAVSRSTADFVTGARQVPRARRSENRLPRRPAERVHRIADKRAGAGDQIVTGLPVGGTVTRLMPAKGNRFLVEAAKLVLDKAPDVHFCLVGEGKLGDDIERPARRLGVAERVRFAGFTRDVSRRRVRCRRSV